MAGPDDIPPVPHPGPRPSAFVFPFAEAAAAASALADMIEEVQAVIDTHETEVDPATENFAGESAQNFLTRFGDEMNDLRALKQDLVTEKDELDAAIATAEQRQSDRQAAISQWDQADQAYDDYQRELANR